MSVYNRRNRLKFFTQSQIFREECQCFKDKANRIKQGYNDPSQTTNARISQILTGTLGGKTTYGNINVKDLIILEKHANDYDYNNNTNYNTNHSNYELQNNQTLSKFYGPYITVNNGYGVISREGQPGGMHRPINRQR